MKYIALIISLLIVSYIGKAQQWKPEYKIIQRDTVHLSGIIYDATGKPIPSIIICSKSTLENIQFPVCATTDEQGRFKLTGAYFNDTLNIHLLGKGNELNIINNGSRYIEIHLPANANAPVSAATQISARRIYKKPPSPHFKVLTNDGALICGVEQFAEFPGGKENFIEFVKRKVTYPAKAIDNNIEGDVEIGFTIERNGSLTNLKILRGIGYDCDLAVINAVIHSPKWKPAIVSGRPAISQSSITINFKLTDR